MSATEHQQVLIEDAARLALLQGQYQKAYQILNDALARIPHFSGAYFLLSRIAYDFKNHLKEVEMLQKAHQLEPDNVVFLVYLARAQALADERKRRSDEREGRMAIETEEAGPRR